MIKFKRHKHEFEPVTRISKVDEETGVVVETVVSKCQCGKRIQYSRTCRPWTNGINKLFSIGFQHSDGTKETKLVVGKSIDDILKRNRFLYDGSNPTIEINEINRVDDYRIFVSDKRM